MPTFTFSTKKNESGSEGAVVVESLHGSPGRAYSNKRTPSWTDRVLYRKGMAELVEVKALYNITASDHVPLIVTLVMR